MTSQEQVRVTQADRDAYDDLMSDDLYDHPPHAVWYFARHRQAAEAEARAREAALRKAGDALRDKLLAFVGATALYTDCGSDVDAIRAWEAL